MVRFLFLFEHNHLNGFRFNCSVFLNISGGILSFFKEAKCTIRGQGMIFSKLTGGFI